MRPRPLLISLTLVFGLLAALVPVSPGSSTARADIAPRIVGGDWVDQEYPWMVSIQRPLDGKPHWCGGALVAPSWVITTAHCLWRPLEHRYFARIATNDRTREGTYLPIVEFVEHPRFKGTHYDIALLRLAEPVSHPLIAPARTAPGVGSAVRLLGFGQTCPTKACLGQNTERMKQLDTTVAPPRDCARATIDSRHELCMRVTPEATSCYGDSGGPAVVRSGDQWVLAGLDGRGGSETCGDGGVTYTDVSRFRDWVADVVSGRHARGW